MTKSETDRQFEQLVHKFYPRSKLLRVWELKGGVSTDVKAFEIARPDGQTQKMIKRGVEQEKTSYKLDEHIVTEFKLMQQLKMAGCTVIPTPYHLDSSGEIFPMPYLVAEYIEGETLFASSIMDVDDYVLQFAQGLASINQYNESNLDLSFLPQTADMYMILYNRLKKTDTTMNKVCTHDIWEALWPIPQSNSSALIHGDLWPGNVLWRDGNLAAILDWEFASIGDPLFDLAFARLDILSELGMEAMYKFTDDYYAAMPMLDLSYLPQWDIAIAYQREIMLNEYPRWFGDDEAVEVVYARLKRFTHQAVEKICLDT